MAKKITGKEYFTECPLSDIRQRIYRVPLRHSAKPAVEELLLAFSLPSAEHLTLDKLG